MVDIILSFNCWNLFYESHLEEKINFFRGRNEEGYQSADPIPAEPSGTADNKPAHKCYIKTVQSNPFNLHWVCTIVCLNAQPFSNCKVLKFRGCYKLDYQLKLQ